MNIKLLLIWTDRREKNGISFTAVIQFSLSMLRYFMYWINAIWYNQDNQPQYIFIWATGHGCTHMDTLAISSNYFVHWSCVRAFGQTRRTLLHDTFIISHIRHFPRASIRNFFCNLFSFSTKNSTQISDLRINHNSNSLKIWLDFPFSQQQQKSMVHRFCTRQPVINIV